MKKQEQFELAKQLHDAGVKYKQIGVVVAQASGRKKPYDGSTMNNWMVHDSYKDYTNAIREAQQRSKKKNGKKEPTKPVQFDGTNSIVSVLKAIEYGQQQTNMYLDRLVTAIEKVGR